MAEPYELTTAEERVKNNAASGKWTLFESYRDPTDPDSWKAEHTIRAKFLRDLCFNTFDAWSAVHDCGILIQGVRIEGNLDLDDLRFDKPLVLKLCRLQGVSLDRARLSLLNFDGTSVDAIRAADLDCRGSVLLRSVEHNGKAHRFECVNVYLYGAKINGTLDCSGASIRDVNAEALECRGSVCLRATNLRNEVLRFEGSGVRLFGATIKGTLDCSGARINSLHGTLLECGSLVLLRRYFFQNKVYKFESNGDVVLDSAKITQSLECFGAKFHGLLDLQEAKVGYYVDTNERLEEGEEPIDVESNWPKPGALKINGFVYDRIEPADSATRKKWLARRKQDPFEPGPFTVLSSVMRAHGHERDATEILVLREKMRLDHGELGWIRSLWAHVLGLTIRHGHSPAWALLWLVLLWVVGVLVCSNNESHLKLMTNNNLPDFDSWLYPLDTIIPLIDLRMERYWVPKGTPAIWLNALFKGMGWVLSTLFVLGFTGVVRRK